MTTVARRLAQITQALGPRATVLAWIAEAHATCDSLEAYATKLAEERDRALPLDRLMDQVERGARHAHSGATRVAQEAAVHAARRDTAFLCYLFIGANQQVIEQERSQEFADCCLHNAREVLRLTGAPLADCRAWVTFAEAILTERYALEAALATVSSGYFSGAALLFPAHAAQLAAWIAAGEATVAAYHALLDGPPATRRRPRLDVTMIRCAAAGEAAATVVHFTVDQAKHQALFMLGERLRAYDYTARHLGELHRGH
jgi:hypothetical protein